MIKKRSEQPIEAIDETFKISKKRNNGILRFFVKTDKKGKIKKYSLCYINMSIFIGDNGRVLGYDNDHGYHHRHHMGSVEKVDYSTFNEIKMRFEKEWREIHDQHQKRK